MLFYYLCHLDHFLNSFFGNILVLTQTSDLAASYVWSGNVRYVYMQATIHSALKEISDSDITLSEKRGRTKSDADRNVLRLDACPTCNPWICSYMRYRLTTVTFGKIKQEIIKEMG